VTFSSAETIFIPTGSTFFPTGSAFFLTRFVGNLTRSTFRSTRSTAVLPAMVFLRTQFAGGATGSGFLQGNRKKFFLGGWIVDFDFDLDFMCDHLRV